MTAITAVRSCTVRVPLKNPTSIARRRITGRDFTLVEVTGDDGHTGVGFCYGGSFGGAVVTSAVRHLFKDLLIGEDPFRVEGLWEDMYQAALLHGRAGSVMRALSALDIAIWDRNARAVGLPLYKMLGGYYRDTVPAYASGGYFLDGKTPKMLGEELAAHVKNGYTAVKIKVGKLSDVKAEEERMAAAREAIGDDVILMLDANNAWPDLVTALRYMAAYEPYDPYWIEEPFSPDDIENHARLAQMTHVPVATGEIEVGRWRFQELLDKDAAAILQTDACVCGGITEWRRIAAMAAGRGVPLCPHWFHDVHAHLVAATPNATYVEYFPDDKVLNFRNLIDNQLECENGQIKLPTAPGLGFNFLPDVVEKNAVDPWD